MVVFSKVSASGKVGVGLFSFTPWVLLIFLLFLTLEIADVYRSTRTSIFCDDIGFHAVFVYPHRISGGVPTGDLVVFLLRAVGGATFG